MTKKGDAVISCPKADCGVRYFQPKGSKPREAGRGYFLPIVRVLFSAAGSSSLFLFRFLCELYSEQCVDNIRITSSNESMLSLRLGGV